MVAEITIVVDNRVGMVRDPYVARHGLAIVVETDDSLILFDTGPSANVLVNNLKLAGFDVSFDHVVLSHEHWDHTGGLEAVEGTVHRPGGGEETLDDVVVTRTFEGEYEGRPMPEQALIVGNVALIGCCHFDLEELLNEYEPRTVVGGLHLMGATEEELERTAELFWEYGVREVYACHCTGLSESAYLAKVVGGEPAYVPMRISERL
ncbi:MBL fold metallo-hydrolase [Methanopyrus sp. KOL6]|uniref:MBL fold metallo-hydrolase n=1 Tax=Methanopyrus sp. KOL6 TaxID=1937004 RepID=UPI000B4B24ED|nr:MBL fold metallo-hydrolase [Methanopyrus sp. KOL6]